MFFQNLNDFSKNETHKIGINCYARNPYSTRYFMYFFFLAQVMERIYQIILELNVTGWSWIPDHTWRHLNCWIYIVKL